MLANNQKIDKNDALAIIQAALLPDVTFIGGKTVEQQQLQSIKRLRELFIKQRDASQNQIIALLSELNLRILKSIGSIIRLMEDVFEDADNGLSTECRAFLKSSLAYLSKQLKAMISV